MSARSDYKITTYEWYYYYKLLQNRREKIIFCFYLSKTKSVVCCALMIIWWAKLFIRKRKKKYFQNYTTVCAVRWTKFEDKKWQTIAAFVFPHQKSTVATKNSSVFACDADDADVESKIRRQLIRLHQNSNLLFGWSEYHYWLDLSQPLDNETVCLHPF